MGTKIPKKPVVVTREAKQEPAKLSNGSLKEWNSRVAIVPWGKYVTYDGQVTLCDDKGMPCQLESPGDLGDWAKERKAWCWPRLSSVVQ